MLEAKGIHKSFNELEVLKGIDLYIKEKEVVSIVGSSGAGKTTLLQILGTLTDFNKGNLLINGKDVSSIGSNKLAEFRNQNIGFIFQFHQLLPEFNAIENVCIPAFIKGTNRVDAKKEAKKLLSYLGLESRLTHKPGELSGGEQQRVATARALINKPKIILADEPSGNLDSKNANDLHQLFFQLSEELNQTFIIVTHNPTLAKQCNRVITLNDGKIV